MWDMQETVRKCVFQNRDLVWPCGIMSVLNWQEVTNLFSRRGSHEFSRLKLSPQHSTTKEDPVTVQRVSIDVERISMQYCWPLSKSYWLKSQELDAGFFYSVVSVGRWLKPSGARLVWSSFDEGSDKGNDERALMRLNPWLESALGLLYLVTLATDPLSPSSHMSLCLPCIVSVWSR